MAADFPHLMSPLKVGARTIRNRVLVTGHIPGLEEAGQATAAFIAYHARRSRGGAGLQMTGTSGFHHTGHASSGRGIDLLQPEVEDGLRRLAEEVLIVEGDRPRMRAMDVLLCPPTSKTAI